MTRTKQIILEYNKARSQRMHEAMTPTQRRERASKASIERWRIAREAKALALQS